MPLLWSRSKGRDKFRYLERLDLLGRGESAVAMGFRGPFPGSAGWARQTTCPERYPPILKNNHGRDSHGEHGWMSGACE